MPKYRKRPVEIEARQWAGTAAGATPIIDWILASGHTARYHDAADAVPNARTEIAIDTLEGTITASPGDWIIRGVQGEFYPCRDGIFRATYEPADTPADPDADLILTRLADAIRDYYRALRLDIDRTQLVEALDAHGVDIDLESDPR